MGFACGIIGLPNVGKSTIFNALSSARSEVANYPFCTIHPHQGIVPVPDARLQKLADLLHPQKVTPTTLEFWDIAGLVKGANEGEGLGNQFLGHIRNVDALAHVVRCFESQNVVHVYDSVDPLRDVSIVQTELLLADLQTVEKYLTKTMHQSKVGDRKSSAEIPLLQTIRDDLAAGRLPAVPTTAEGKKIWQSLALLSSKSFLYVGNADEKELRERKWIPRMEEIAAREKVPLVVICGDIEAAIADLTEAERNEFIKEMGLPETALHQLIRAGYAILHLITFYTIVGPELRAWTVPWGTPAPQAAGKIHSDMERGFIRAEVIAFADFTRWGSVANAREKGAIRVEGKEYIVKDGDILTIRFHE